MSGMSPRERLSATFSLKKPDHVPMDVWWTPHAYEEFQKHGAPRAVEFSHIFDHRGVGWGGTNVKYDFSKYYPDGLPEGTWVGEWGEANTPGNYYHYTIHRQPLASLKTVQELKDYPWPDIKAAYRHEHLEEEVKKLHDEGWFVIGNVGHMGWEKGCYMRGILNVSLDLVDNQEFAACMFDIFCDLYSFMARRFAEAGVDMVWLSEDVGMQNQLMISPAMYRKWIKPRTKAVIDAARNVNPKVWIGQHHCGYVEPLIDDFIEIGINDLHPDPARKHGSADDQK